VGSDRPNTAAITIEPAGRPCDGCRLRPPAENRDPQCPDQGPRGPHALLWVEWQEQAKEPVVHRSSVQRRGMLGEPGDRSCRLSGRRPPPPCTRSGRPAIRTPNEAFGAAPAGAVTAAAKPGAASRWDRPQVLSCAAATLGSACSLGTRPLAAGATVQAGVRLHRSPSSPSQCREEIAGLSCYYPSDSFLCIASSACNDAAACLPLVSRRRTCSARSCAESDDATLLKSSSEP
jgi:hypothetical protein